MTPKIGEGDASAEASASKGEAELQPLDNVLNFRDVGKTINDFLGEKRLVEGCLYRSARPDDASILDRNRLRDEYNIKTIMDLRTTTEHLDQARKRELMLNDESIAKPTDAFAEPLKIPDVNYLEINLNGKGFERNLLWKLSYWNIAKLTTLMVLGYRIEAIGIIGREVLLPRGLIGLGCDSIDFCGPEIDECLRAFAYQENYGILVHCTQGKDRTGLIVALILFLLEMPMDAITTDYTMSEAELEPEMEARLVEIKSIGLTEDFARCPKDWIKEMDTHLREKYGGVKAYLQVIGFDEEDQQRLIDSLKA